MPGDGKPALRSHASSRLPTGRQARLPIAPKIPLPGEPATNRRRDLNQTAARPALNPTPRDYGLKYPWSHARTPPYQNVKPLFDVRTFTLGIVMKSLMIAAAAALCLVAGTANATDVTVGVDDAGNNCLPYACGLGSDVSQQIYAASQFTSGPMEIGAISFFKDIGASFGTGTVDTLTFSLAFYTTSKTVNSTANGGPDPTNLAGNLGTLLSNFGTFTVSGVLPDVLTLTGNAFTYNPAAGNLLLQITPISGVAAFDGAFFQADSRGVVTRRIVGPSRFGNGPIALVTRFSSPTAVVPEPATWAMLVGGFGGVGFAIRRRKVRATYA